MSWFLRTGLFQTLFLGLLVQAGVGSAWADIYVSDSALPSVRVFADGASGDAVPLRVIAGPATTLDHPTGVAADARWLYVADAGSRRILFFSPLADGDETPAKQIEAVPGTGALGIAVAGDWIYLADASADAVMMYPVAAAGAAPPARTIQGELTGLAAPRRLAVSADEIWVASGGTGHITTYPLGATGDVIPTLTIPAAAFGLGGDCALAAAYGYLYIANPAAHNLVMAPLALFHSDPTPDYLAIIGVIQPADLAVDAHWMYVLAAAGGTPAIQIFDRECATAVPLERTIQGPATGLDEPTGVAVQSLTPYAVYAAHVASTDLWWTRMTVVNTGSADAPVTFEAFTADGQRVEAHTLPSLPPAASIRADVDTLFTPTTLAQDLWVRILSAAPLKGVVEFGTRDNQSQVVMPLFSGGHTELTYPYVVEMGDWYTGMAVINLGVQPAQVSMSAYTQDGVFLHSNTETVVPGGKFVRMVSQAFPEIADPSTIRMVRVEADQPVLGFELFGNLAVQGLAGLPAAAGEPATARKAADTYTLYYPEIPPNDTYYTGVTFSNQGEQPCTAVVELLDSDGNPLSQRSWTVQPLQQVTREIWFALDDAGTVHPNARALRITADQPLLGFELFFTRSGPFIFDGVTAAARFASTLIFPLVQPDAAWFTSLRLLNPAGQSAAFTVRAFDATGAVAGTYSGSLASGSKLEMNLDDMFPSPAAPIAWLAVIADTGLLGDVFMASADATRLGSYLGFIPALITYQSAEYVIHDKFTNKEIILRSRGTGRGSAVPAFQLYLDDQVTAGIPIQATIIREDQAWFTWLGRASEAVAAEFTQGHTGSFTTPAGSYFLDINAGGDLGGTSYQFFTSPRVITDMFSAGDKIDRASGPEIEIQTIPTIAIQEGFGLILKDGGGTNPNGSMVWSGAEWIVNSTWSHRFMLVYASHARLKVFERVILPDGDSTGIISENYHYTVSRNHYTYTVPEREGDNAPDGLGSSFPIDFNLKWIDTQGSLQQIRILPLVYREVRRQ